MNVNSHRPWLLVLSPAFLGLLAAALMLSSCEQSRSQADPAPIQADIPPTESADTADTGGASDITNFEIVSDRADANGVVEVSENTTEVATLSAEGVSETAKIDYVIADGEDKDFFTVDSAGAISFKQAPDWETPSDADQNNNYKVFVQGIHPTGTRKGQFLVVKVIDVQGE
ncbi:MAG: cadherin repeat domain-containing protein [Leptolyngbya sp. SIO4C1]|nr:cadherin repeat domain-containing protein [Leptolyngbya sp. SIO4C1]